VDPYGRRIRYLRLSVTDRCNLRCRYCMPAGGIKWVPHDKVLTYEEMERILRVFFVRGVDKVRITGGEPLTRRGLQGFIERLSSMGSIKDLSLTTNGVLLARMAPSLKKAGLHRVNVSLDTLDRRKFEHIAREDVFDDVIRGICAAYENGLGPVKINVVAIRGFNDTEVVDFAGLTLKLDVEVRFIELMPMGCIKRYHKRGHVNPREIVQRIEGRYGPLEGLDRGLGPAAVYRIAGAPGRIGLIGALSGHGFCASCNRIRVTALGRLRPCLFSKDEIDLLTPLRCGIPDRELESLIEHGVSMKPRVRESLRRMGMQRKGAETGWMFDIGG
jgi:cyclic pyranopterin phosphate synthase